MNNKKQEIERKYLVDKTKWIPKNKGTKIVQYYLSDMPTVRIRIYGEHAFVTIKGPSKNITRSEYEYEIPLQDAKEMIELSISNPIQKIRYDEYIDGQLWTVDVFEGDNEGLIIAEVELESEDQEITIPDWVTEDVSNINKYYNCSLAKKPYKEFNNFKFRVTHS